MYYNDLAYGIVPQKLDDIVVPILIAADFAFWIIGLEFFAISWSRRDDGRKIDFYRGLYSAIWGIVGLLVWLAVNVIALYYMVDIGWLENLLLMIAILAFFWLLFVRWDIFKIKKGMSPG